MDFDAGHTVTVGGQLVMVTREEAVITRVVRLGAGVVGTEGPGVEGVQVGEVEGVQAGELDGVDGCRLEELDGVEGCGLDQLLMTE